MNGYPDKERGCADPQSWDISKNGELTGLNYTNRSTGETTDLPHHRLFDLSRPKGMSRKEFNERCDRSEQRELQQKINRRNRRG